MRRSGAGDAEIGGGVRRVYVGIGGRVYERAIVGRVAGRGEDGTKNGSESSRSGAQGLGAFTDIPRRARSTGSSGDRDDAACGFTARFFVTL